MKKFIEENGTFEIEIPYTWKYSIVDGKIHTFNAYEKWIPDVFKISILDIHNEKEIINFLQISELLPIKKIGNKEYYCHPNINGKSGFISKSWSTLFGNKLVYFSFTYPKNPDTVLDNRTLEEKLQIVYSIIEGFKFDVSFKNVDELNIYRFNMFNLGNGEAELLLNKAVANDEIIQIIYILANQIDGLLRTGIILKTQILKNNRNIEIEWIYQRINDKIKSDKDILKKAFVLDIIDQITFEELSILYDEKDFAMPKIILSEITSTQLKGLVINYYHKKKAIVKIISNIEVENMKLGNILQSVPLNPQ